MSRPFDTLLKDTDTGAIASYLTDTHALKQIIHVVKNCADDSNVYKNIASLESLGVLNSEEVPTGTAKDKMSYLLAEAITAATSIVANNLNAAGAIVKQWGETAIVDNQGARLDAVLTRLKRAAKSDPIPAYSNLSEAQRERVQRIFNSHVNAPEPVSIDFITEAIDRYNAGADYATLTRALDIKIEYKHAVGIYDESRYQKLKDPSILTHLAFYFDTVKTITDNLKTAGSKVPMDAFLGNLRLLKTHTNTQAHYLLKSYTEGLDSAVPSDEYTSQIQTNAGYGVLKSQLNRVNHIEPLSTNMVNRLNALTRNVAKLAQIEILSIDVTHPDMGTTNVYTALSEYLEFVEDLTQTLVVYAFITQIAMRNNTLTEEVIEIATKLADTVDTLFTEVNQSIPENGEVSQESFSAAINFIKSKLPGSLNEQQVVKQQHVFSRLTEQYHERVTALERAKLKGLGLNAEHSTLSFKNKYTKHLNDTLGVDISEYTGEDLFNFMTSEYLNATHLTLNGSAVGAQLIADTDQVSAATRALILSHTLTTELLSTPFTTVGIRTYTSATDDLQDHLSQLSDALRTRDESDIKRSIDNFSYFLNEGSYYHAVMKFTQIPPLKYLTNVSKTTYTAFDGQSYPLGYDEIDRRSQELLVSVFGPSVSKVSLNRVIHNQNYGKLGLVLPEYYQLNQKVNAFINSKGNSIGVKGLTNMVKQIESVKQSLMKSSSADKTVIELMDALKGDVNSAISDVTFRARLIELFYELSLGINRTLCDVYAKDAVMLDDYLDAIK